MLLCLPLPLRCVKTDDSALPLDSLPSRPNTPFVGHFGFFASASETKHDTKATNNTKVLSNGFAHILSFQMTKPPIGRRVGLPLSVF